MDYSTTLNNLTIKGNIVYLPEIQLAREVYNEVKNTLSLIGGKWKGGKVGGFVFKENPTHLISDIVAGKHRNLQQEFQFFATPDGLAEELVEWAELYSSKGKFLEPSAGQGAIIQAARRVYNTEFHFDAYELMSTNLLVLKGLQNISIVGENFLDAPEDILYSRIIANPPFAKNQDIAHVRKMYDILEDDGILVSVMSNSWRKGGAKIQREFREWLWEVGARIKDIPAGTFKESGTTVGATIIKIKKGKRLQPTFTLDESLFTSDMKYNGYTSAATSLFAMYLENEYMVYQKFLNMLNNSYQSILKFFEESYRNNLIHQLDEWAAGFVNVKEIVDYHRSIDYQ